MSGGKLPLMCRTMASALAFNQALGVMVEWSLHRGKLKWNIPDLP